ncbi:MAG: histidinol-phosphate transaminase [Burkholderiaceae bacterium]
MNDPSQILADAVVRPDVLAMAAYPVQDASGLLKMDAMENPHRLSPELQRQLGVRLGAVALNRYPSHGLRELADALAQHAQVPAGCSIVLGNGSDELIAMLSIACDRPDACVLAPMPGFVMYGVSAKLQGLRFVGVPLQQDFELDEAAMLTAVAQHRPAIVYLAYPNNPTANLWDADAMERIIAAAPGLVVIDEAYQPFAGRSFMERITRYSNVLLMRTMSKFGLAGVRIGYLVGPHALIGQIDKVRPPYNISVLNAQCALFALEHADVFAQQARDIVTQRKHLYESLQAMAGVQAYPSDANMLLVRILSGHAQAADRVHQAMKTRGVLVKNMSATDPLLRNCLRLTVGTTDENHAMLAALKASL